MNLNKNPIDSNFKTKGKRKLVIFKHTHPVYLSQSKTGHIATENHSHNFRFPLALLSRLIVSFFFFSEIGGWAYTWYITFYTSLVQKWGVGAYMVVGAYKVLYSTCRRRGISLTLAWSEKGSNRYSPVAILCDRDSMRIGRRATRGVTVSMSDFLACHQCYRTGSSLAWGLNLRAVVCGIF